MKILQLCNKPPFPPIEGGPIAMNAITQGLLNDGHTVKVMAVTSFKFDDAKFTDENLKQKISYTSIFINLKINPLKAFFNLFSKKSYHVQRFYTRKFRDKLISILNSESFDIIHIESIFLACYVSLIRKYSNAKIVIRTHNVEHLIWERLSKNSSKGLKKWYLKHLASTLKMFELSILNQVDGILAISKNDLNYFLTNGIVKPIIEIPFGVNIPQNGLIRNKIITSNFSAFFIGSLNWQPNIEGMDWFIQKVWLNPKLSLPDIELFVAGRNIPESFKKYESNRIHIVGEVEDAYEFMSKHSIMIVPLFSGSGIRIKIIEGLMMGKAIISTSIGAEGINCENGENIIIANTPSEFEVAIKNLVNNPYLYEKISSNAPYLIEKEHNNNLITSKMIEFYKSII